MSNVSIYSRNWIDLVFEGKNKTYGAYQLRQENPKTTLLAFISGLLLFFTVFSLGVFLSNFEETSTSTTPKLPENTVIQITNFTQHNNPAPPKKTLAVPIKKSNPTEKTVKKENTHFVVAQTNVITDDVKPNEDLKSNPATLETTVLGTETSNGSGTGTETGGSTTGTSGETAGNNEINSPSELDYVPEFPGGMKKFYDYVGNNIERPELDDNLRSKTLSVFVAFVIEKDGSMSEIKVMRSSDAELEKAAIKVLKSLKTKWKPGIKNGVNVRTRFVLPIKVNY